MKREQHRRQTTFHYNFSDHSLPVSRAARHATPTLHIVNKLIPNPAAYHSERVARSLQANTCAPRKTDEAKNIPGIIKVNPTESSSDAQPRDQPA
jgi:hypothetical protein